jgi:hypothetical protein
MKRISSFAIVLGVAGAAFALQEKGVGYDDTPQLPDQQWKVHDSRRPVPLVVTPGNAAGKPPSDAVMLFDGKDLSKWHDGKGNASKWKVEEDYFEAVRGAGAIATKDEFGDIQLHLEWRVPDPPEGTAQGRGNSGVFLMGRYELQILDSYENRTYADGQAASMYGQWPPLVNASRKPGEWQVYDAIFISPRFKEGKLESPAYLTVLHNGVVVHHKQAYIGGSTHKQVGKYAPHPDKGPLKLQEHGDPVRFRNIWIRKLQGYDGQ